MEKSTKDLYVVKTALHTSAPWIRKKVEEVVQLRSRAECFGNAVFCTAVLDRFSKLEEAAENWSEASQATVPRGVAQVQAGGAKLSLQRGPLPAPKPRDGDPAYKLVLPLAKGQATA
jgi:hypothetical protein